MQQQRWLAVWLENWPIQRRQASTGLGSTLHRGVTPAEALNPLLLWDEDPRRGRLVMAACEFCQQLGIQCGMPLHEAIELAGRAAMQQEGPTLSKPLPGSAAAAVVERYDPQADRRGLSRLADQLLLEISPLVAIEPQAERAPWAGLQRRCSEMLLVNITGIGDWFGSEQTVFKATGDLLQRQGLRAAMAIADAPAAAWGLVRFGGRRETWVPPGQTAAAVDPLPVRSLRITTEVAHQLDRLGIQTVGQLRRLPRAGLATRLGEPLVRRIDQMLSVQAEPLAMHHSEPEDAAVCELEYPTTDLEILQHRTGQLIDALAARLRAAVRGALRLSCRLDLLEGHPPRRIEVGLFAPTADAEHLRRLTLPALEGKQLPAMVQRLSVSVDLAGPLRPVQGTLFGDGSVSDAAAGRTLARMIETVAMRLGCDAVLAVSPSDHPLPEAAYRERALAGQGDRPLLSSGGGARGRKRGGGAAQRRSGPAVKSPRRSLLPAPAGPLPSDPLRRPLRLLERPQRIAVVMSPADGVLVRLRIGGCSGDREPGRTYRVLKCWGPERLETTAATGRATRRDYYRVETEGGVWFWLFRHWRPGIAETWYLHGRFD